LKSALKVAEIKATDKEDMENCVNDMQKFASLNEDEARVVAAAVRAKHLPNIVRESGLEAFFEEPATEVHDLEGKATADFAKEKTKDIHDDAEGEFVEEEDFTLPNSTDDLKEDQSEAIDSNIATFQIEVPADKVEVAQKAVQEALDKALGTEVTTETSEDDSDEELEGLADEGTEPEIELEGDKDIDLSNDAEDALDFPQPKTAHTVNTMTPEAKDQRRAAREALLQRTVVAEDASKPQDRGLGKDTTEGTYGGEKATAIQHDSEAQYAGEKDYPTMTLKGSEGNSLKADNPTYAPQHVPTMNPENLQLKGSVDAVKLDGTPDGTLEYVIDFDKLDDVPSADADRGPAFEIPTQMDSVPRNTAVPARIASDSSETRLSEVEDVVYNLLVEAGVDSKEIENLTVAQGVKLFAKIASAKGEEKTSDVQVEINAEDKKSEREASLREGRIKTSFACAYKLASHGLLPSEEVESYADTMMKDGLPADSMIRQTSLLLRSAKSNAERVASAAAENLSVRAASKVGLSTSPALTGGIPASSAPLDIQASLRGIFTMPNVDED
jgi:hypothetical protein